MNEWRMIWTSDRSIWVHRPKNPLDPSSTGQLASWIMSQQPDLVRAAIPDSCGVLIEVEINHASYPTTQGSIESLLNTFEHVQSSFSQGHTAPEADEIVVPVCYDPSVAPDLLVVAEQLRCDPGHLIEMHSGARYQVLSMGFMPGFGYLGSVDASLRLPRKATPRIRVPAGSVAIAEYMTAVYPHQSAGGWHLIGRTPMRLFDPTCPQPALLCVGDWVRFESIPLSAYEAIALKRTSEEHVQ